jgi:hypothetical protein
MADEYSSQRLAYEPQDMCVPEGGEGAGDGEAVAGGAEGAGEGPSRGGMQPQIIHNIFNRDSTLLECAERLAKKAKAEGTISNYTGMTNRFREFCGSQGYSYEEFDEQTVLHFVLDLDKNNASVSTLGQVKPALTLAERLAGRERSAFTATVDTYLEAAKRRAAEAREPARKAGELPEDTIERLLEAYARPYWDGEGKADPYMLRTLMRAVIERYTFCRFSCYSKLRVCDLEDKGDCIKILFTSAKNDQFHKGSISYIVNSDALKLIRFTCSELGFRLGDSSDKSLLNCALHKGKDRVTVMGQQAVCYSNSTRDLRRMLEQAGIDPTGATDKSFKSLGVTTSLDKGVPLEDVAHHGRWRTLTMPLTYKLNSEKYKKGVAGKI